MTERAEEDFDAVRMMREIRDDLSRKLVGLSHEEQQAYVREQLGSESREEGDRPRPRKRSTG
jgi:hypothetical protein